MREDVNVLGNSEQLQACHGCAEPLDALAGVGRFCEDIHKYFTVPPRRRDVHAAAVSPAAHSGFDTVLPMVPPRARDAHRRVIHEKDGAGHGCPDALLTM